MCEVLVDRVRAWTVGAELEADGLARLRALGDAIRVDGEAVGDVVGGEGDLHHVVLCHFEARRRELEPLRVDGKLALALRRQRGREQDNNAGDECALHSALPLDADWERAVVSARKGLT